ncbi:hypothetical protein LSCM4_07621 [Leishmania orientalis]|uniref:SET domain-containing protein n=1 Tax=Leishmania orientalis TaxID=2249476 RepID=A0A836KRJ7_9TRYP|nr:hypothetical protein LSCM4_07621 [Leishmania orientalis]
MLLSPRVVGFRHGSGCILGWGCAASSKVTPCLSRTAQRAMSTSSASPTAPAASSVSRRSRRRSYADADRIYGENDTTASLWGLRQSPRAGLPSAPVSNSSYTPRLASLRARAQQRWLMVLLALMRTQYVGSLTMRLLTASAYAAYVKGSVMIFTRRRVGPPVDIATETESFGGSVDLCEAGCSARTPAPQVPCADGLPKGSALATSPCRSPASRPSSVAAFSSAPFSRGPPLHDYALDCLYIGDSPIHSRGLFTARALPRGTRIIAEPHRSLLIAPHAVTFLGDTHEKLPDTWHYTQPTGSIVELVTQAQPHHLMNHSCAANVCSGLSRAFWEAAMIADTWQQQRRQHQRSWRLDSTASRGSGRAETFNGIARAERITRDHRNQSLSSLPFAVHTYSANWSERLTRWPYFADANSFFLTRDVEAGEELTLDYSTRMAPLYAGELACALTSRSWLLCRCGQPCCRHYVYRPRPEVSAFLRTLGTRRCRQGRGGHSPGQHNALVAPNGTAPPDTMDVCDPVHIIAKLLELGFDDELVLLSYAASSTDVVAYLYGQPIPSLQRFSPTPSRASSARLCPSSTAQEGIDVEVRRMSKRQLLSEYRYVFRLLNEAVPARACLGGGKEEARRTQPESDRVRPQI